MSAGGLRGRRILVTRASHQAEELAEALRQRGALAITVPVMALEPLLSEAELLQLRRGISEGRWDDLVFTSANAVRLVLPRREGTTPPLRLFAIGPGTAAAAARQGWLAEPLPQSFIAEGLIEQLREADLAGRRVLLPRAAGARAVLPAALEQLGAQLELVAVYRMVALESSRAYLAEALRDPRLDCVVFASGSSVGCFAHLRSGRPLPSTVRVVCIGPITAGAAEEAGFQPWLVAKDHSLDGLLAALELELGRLPENGGQS